MCMHIVLLTKKLFDEPIDGNICDMSYVFAAYRLVMKGGSIEMNADALGFTMESNGVRILEPFDTSVMYSNASGKTNIKLIVSDIFMNFSFSILKLFLAVQDDILAFLRMSSKKMTVTCTEFDKIGTIKSMLRYFIAYDIFICFY